MALLDCTLRDGGYLNQWNFTPQQMCSTVNNLAEAGIDYIEIGYLTSILSDVGGARFADIEAASEVLSEAHGKAKFVVMADPSQFDRLSLCRRSPKTVDGIRVVFYKRQIEQAFSLCRHVIETGYDLFLQPMVTVDYSRREFGELVDRFLESFDAQAVSIVDSFGCMSTDELDGFVETVLERSREDVSIGYHGHDNMNLAFANAISLFSYKNGRRFIIDASVCGIGRGAGNLRTELIAHFCNGQFGNVYDLRKIFNVISEVAEPVSRAHKPGYSPYYMLTAMHRAHPNFADFLLESHDVSVSEFAGYVEAIPEEMLTRCTRPYVEKLYRQLKGAIS